jgi:hypothetical protein
MNFDLTEERRKSNEELQAKRLEAGSAFLFTTKPQPSTMLSKDT